MDISIKDLKTRQGWPLEKKIGESLDRISEFYDYYKGMVYVSFSGGKDSTVLLHLAREFYPDMPAVFVDTGIEYPEIRAFVKTMPNVKILHPKMSYKRVIETYGYPIGSKRVAEAIHNLQNPTERNVKTRKLVWDGISSRGFKSRYRLADKWRKLVDSPYKVSRACCDILKKRPIREYEKQTGRKGYVGIMASDSVGREDAYLKSGCNTFGKHPLSRPLSFWTESDVWNYINTYKVPYSKIYDEGYDRTGCIFCMFGLTMDTKPNRFQRLAFTHPGLYKKGMSDFHVAEICNFLGIEYKPEQTTLNIFEGFGR